MHADAFLFTPSFAICLNCFLENTLAFGKINPGWKSVFRPLLKKWPQSFIRDTGKVAFDNMTCRWIQKRRVRTKTRRSNRGYFKCVSVWLSSFCGQWEGYDPVNRFNHTNLVAIVAPTDRPKSARSRCVIEVFGGVLCCHVAFWILMSVYIKLLFCVRSTKNFSSTNCIVTANWKIGEPFRMWCVCFVYEYLHIHIPSDFVWERTDGETFANMVP